MRAAAALALVVALGGVARAQPQRLDPSTLPAASVEPPQIVLLTFGVGPRIFEKFGHAALCLYYDQSREEPTCFNYGVTDFNEGSAMVWHFLRTEQKFWVEPESWSAMVRFYRAEDRDIWMQVLPLPPDQARAIEQKLLYDIQEDHKYYFYDHFFDNCTTRLRDMIDRATGGKLSDGAGVAYPLTFREIGHSGLSEFPFMTALADYVLGRQLDDTPTLWQAMFHPDVLRQQVEDKLHVPARRLYKRRGPAFPSDGPTDRLPALGIALVFALPLLVATWRRRFQRLALAWATLYLALGGVVIWGLVLVSSIPGVRWNEAVFVLMPLDVVLPLLRPARRRTYARVRVIGLALVSALVAIGIFHQPLWIPILSAFMPLAIVAFSEPA
ncbi:MAG TPA: DUF4105 domain-containing protein [Kofleriaceae bacterium]|nr:DUF4105 domain-containing protein [Kofleriaceae bacterium]